MAVSLELRAALPRGDAACRKEASKGPAKVIEFRGKKPEPEHPQKAEREQFVFGLISAEEDKRPTLAPKSGSEKAKMVEEIIRMERPTLRPGSKKTSFEPATEDLMLASGSDEYKSTNSFAPPPLPPIAQITFDDVEVIIEDAPVETKRTNRITPVGGIWTIDADLLESATG